MIHIALNFKQCVKKQQTRNEIENKVFFPAIAEVCISLLNRKLSYIMLHVFK